MRTAPLYLTCIFVAFLTACGGGGGSTSPSAGSSTGSTSGGSAVQPPSGGGSTTSGSGGSSTSGGTGPATAVVAARVEVFDHDAGGILVFAEKPGVTFHIDLSSDSLFGQAAVGAFPFDIRAVPGSNSAVVSNLTDHTLSVINVKNPGTPVSTIATGETLFGPTRIFIPNSSTGYVLLHDSLGVIDLQTNTLMRKISLVTNPFLPPDPTSIVGPDGGNFFYVLNFGDKSVFDFDAASLTPTVLPQTISADFLAISSNQAHVYAVSSGGFLFTIRTSDDALTSTLPINYSPTSAVYDTTNKVLLVASAQSNTLSIIDGLSDHPAVLATVPTGNFPIAIAVLPDGSRTYVANNRDNTVTVMNNATHATKTIAVGVAPIDIAASADSQQVIVANQGSSTYTAVSPQDQSITIISTVDDTVVKTLSNTQLAPPCPAAPCPFVVPVRVIAVP